MKHIRSLGTLTALLTSLLVAGCAVPSSPVTGGAKVVFHTPYGAQGRAFEGGYFQSSVVPQNLEAVLTDFVVTLSGGPGGPLTKTVSFNDASQFVFDDVPAGMWNLVVEGRNNVAQVVARGVYNTFPVINGQLTDIPGLITVSPTRPAAPGTELGKFSLVLHQVPLAVYSVYWDYQEVNINPDGTFQLVNKLQSTPDLLAVELEAPDASGYRTIRVKTNPVYQGETTGTMQLSLQFKNADGTLVHTFQPVFTVDIYQNLESTLDLTLPSDLSNVSAPAPQSLSVTTDVSGNAIVHWQRTPARNLISAYQVAQTPVGSNTPPTNGQILTTVPNVGWLTSANTAVNLSQQPGGSAQFWVRTISAGLYASAWVSVTAVDNLTPSVPFDFYVSLTGNDANDGSLAAPVATIQKAIDLAQLRQRLGQETRIKVAEGLYNLSAGLINKPRDVDGLGGIEAAVPISLLGGYYNGFTQRGDPVNHATVLHDTRTTGDAASQWAEIFFDQTGLPTLPTPQTIDGFTIEQTITNLGTDTVVGVYVAGAINLTVSHMTLVQNAPANASGVANGLQIEVNRTATDPARTIVLQANQIFQRASGATHGTPSGVFWQGIWVALAAGGETPNPLIRVENNLVVHEATTGENYPISIQPISASARIRNNTVVTDLMAGQVALQVYPADSLVENNLLVNLNPAVGNALQGNGLASSPGLVFHNNVISGYSNPYWDGSTGASLAGINNHSSSSANQEVLSSSIHFTNPPLGNYRLTTDTDAGILNGGFNGSSSWPYWPFNTDLDGTVRTNGWTPGAYETDVPPKALALFLGDGGGNDNWGLILKDDGSLLGTGYGGDGRVGGLVGNTTFGSVSPGFPVSTIAVGAHASFAISTSGYLYSAGNGSQGALGHGDGSTKLVFTQVPGLSGVTQVSGGGDTSFARLSNGDLYAAGWNNYGQTGLSLGTSQYNSFTLTASNVLKGVSGYYHGALVKNDGTAWAAGQGNLGDGTYHDGTSAGWFQVLTAVATPLTNVVDVAAGLSFDAYLDSSGQLWTTGNSPVASTSYATVVATNVKAVYAGQSNASAILLILKNDDTLWYAGSNWFQYFDGSWQSTYGLIGNGNIGTSPISVFTQVATNVASAAAGENQWGYVAKNGEVWVNGSNGAGGIGLGSGTTYVTTLTKAVLP